LIRPVASQRGNIREIYNKSLDPEGPKF